MTRGRQGEPLAARGRQGEPLAARGRQGEPLAAHFKLFYEIGLEIELERRCD